MVVCCHSYQLPEHKINVVRDELKGLLDMGVIEVSHSDWSRLVVLVPKSNGVSVFM